MSSDDCMAAVLDTAALLERNLSPDGLRRLRSHIASCATCREALAHELAAAFRESMFRESMSELMRRREHRKPKGNN